MLCRVPLERQDQEKRKRGLKAARKRTWSARRKQRGSVEGAGPYKKAGKVCVAEGTPPTEAVADLGSTAFPTELFSSFNDVIGPCINRRLLIHAAETMSSDDDYGVWTEKQEEDEEEEEDDPGRPETTVAATLAFNEDLFPNYFPLQEVDFTTTQWNRIKMSALSSTKADIEANVYRATFSCITAPLESAIVSLPSITKDKGPLMSRSR